jgi:GT2 family glycosyltransferase
MKKTAYMATFPPRIGCLKKAVQSLCGQVDELHVFCNKYNRLDFEDIRELIALPNVFFYDYMKHTQQDIGALGKIIFCHDWDGYIFLADDDFVYPPDYIEKLTKAVDKYDKKAVISFHGQINNIPSKSYYKDIVSRYAVVRNLQEDTQVHIPGTGVMGFHSSVFDATPLNLGEFQYTNMLDLLFAIVCKRRNIKTIVAAHKAYWVDICPGFRDPAKSIWIANRDDDRLQTDIFNRAKFKKI